jgi:GH15 family glucan-1,4-alpha-glucosidase
MSLDGLAARSVAVVREHQAASGAYVAAPFPAPYRNAWLRDGAFVADAMSSAGEGTSAEAFFAWCARVVEARAERMAAAEILDGRFTVDEREVPGPWSGAQLDGYGAWVWALGGHVQRHGVDAAPWLPAARVSLRYAADCWQTPCFDWWEERCGVHVATLASLYGGLSSGLVEEDWATEAAESIRAAVLRDGVVDGRLAARLEEGGLDASLIAAATPFGLVAADAPVMEATVRGIESELVFERGVHRHRDDEFYGGGLWLLLAGLLGWHYARSGREDDARAQLEWIGAAATRTGDLPEQVDEHLLRPEKRDEWVGRWGPPACPLLWSHALFLTLTLELGALRMENAA